MKNLFTLLFVLLGVSTFAQQNTGIEENSYFAQVKLTDLSTDQISILSNQLSDNPSIFVYRYDALTDGLLIITNSISDFNDEVVEVWLGDFNQSVECLNIGVKGMDKQLAFNSEFCTNLNNQ